MSDAGAGAFLHSDGVGRGLYQEKNNFSVYRCHIFGSYIRPSIR